MFSPIKAEYGQEDRLKNKRLTSMEESGILYMFGERGNTILKEKRTNGESFPDDFEQAAVWRGFLYRIHPKP